MRPALQISLLLLTLIVATPSIALDVAIEQYSVTAAKKKHDDAKSDYDAATLLLKEQEQRIAQDQERLKELQKRQSAAKTRLTKAKAQLDHQQEVLDKAWKAGGK
jgi:dsDNA-specific endonuclease/ATPase MutS2